MQIYTFAERTFDASPLLYYKGDQLLRLGYPFFLPSREERFVAFPSLAVRIGRLGKEVAERFAHRYIDAIGVGFDIVAPDRLANCRAAGLPWESAVAFGEAAAAAFTRRDCGEELAERYSLCFGQDGEDFRGEMVVTEASIRRAVAIYSDSRMIKQGDILLLHPDVFFAPPLPEKETVSLRDEAIFLASSARENRALSALPLEIGSEWLIGFTCTPSESLLRLRIR